MRPTSIRPTADISVGSVVMGAVQSRVWHVIARTPHNDRERYRTPQDRYGPRTIASITQSRCLWDVGGIQSRASLYGRFVRLYGRHATNASLPGGIEVDTRCAVSVADLRRTAWAHNRPALFAHTQSPRAICAHTIAPRY
jgi:hypothetical protein